MNETDIGGHSVGPERGAFIIAEIGINHNGDIDTAKRLINAAVAAGANAVKFQKRDPELAVPKDQWGEMKDTPWGRMNYITYKKRMEFWKKDYDIIDAYCEQRGIMWSASVWDMASADFIISYDPPFVKIPSAKITDIDLLKYVTDYGGPVVMSTGMSYPWEIDNAVRALREPIIMHCTSTYPCPLKQVNLLHIETLQEAFPQHIIGYSNHNPGIMACVAASIMGANVIEAHITLDRAMWGTDQAASFEPQGFARMVKYIRDMEKAMGNGIKRVYLEEKAVRAKLRGE